MATNNKDFIVKNGLIVGDSTNLVNYSSASPSNPFVGQLWINEPYLYAWSSASTWVLVGDGNTGGGGGGSASGTPFNIPSTLVARSASGLFQIGAVDFHTASPVSTAIGRVTWSDGDGTIILGLKGGNLNLPIGQEEDALCYNGTGSALSRGQVVRIIGAQGQRPQIDLAAAISDPNSSKTFGLVAEPIANGAEGFVTTFGIVQNVNTAAFTEGSSLWLSPSAGGIVSTMPTQPYHNVFIGYCLKSHASSGRIFVKIQNGYEIQELHDVLIQTASNNQILSYNSASSLWMNKDLQAAIKEVDGPGSGIDADLLDGQNGSYYLDWTNTTNKPDPIIAVSLSGNTTGAASVTLTDLTNGQISITTNTTHAGTASSIAGSLVTGIVNNANQANTASSINWAGVTAKPNLVNSVTGGSGITIGGTNSDPTVSLNAGASVSWGNVSSKPSPIVGVELLGDVTGAASATLSQLANGQISINTTVAANAVALGTDTTGNYVAGVTGGNGISITGAAGEGWSPTIAINSSASVDWGNVSSKPDPIIGVNLIGTITGAASATLTDLQNGQITITTSGGGGSASVDWLTQVNNKPDPIVGVSLTGAITGAASATLTDLTNGQISVTTSYGAISTNAQTGTSYTLALSDAGKIIEMNNAAANLVVIPLNSTAAFPTGTKIDIIQTGAGATSASIVSGVTLNSEAGKRTVNAQWQAASLVKRGTDTWVMIGAIKA